MWWRPSIRVNSYTVLSATCLFHCNSSISFVTSFLWFQHSPPLVTSFLSFQLLPSVCCQVVHFVTSVLTFHLVYKPHLLQSFLSFVVAFDALLSSLWPLALAATCSHLRPLAASGRKWLLFWNSNTTRIATSMVKLLESLLFSSWNPHCISHKITTKSSVFPMFS